jgi:hypothetical protein
LLLHGRSTKHKRCSQVALPSQTITTASSSPSTSTASNVISVEFSSVETEISNSDLVDQKLTASQYLPGTIVESIESIVSHVDDDLPIKKCRVQMTEPSDGMHHHQQHHHHHDISSAVEDHHHEEILPEDTRNNHHEDIHDGIGDEERDPIEIDSEPPQINVIRVVDKAKPSQSSIIYTQENYRGHTVSTTVRRRRGRIAAEPIRPIKYKYKYKYKYKHKN